MPTTTHRVSQALPDKRLTLTAAMPVSTTGPPITTTKARQRRGGRCLPRGALQLTLISANGTQENVYTANADGSGLFQVTKTGGSG